MDATELSMQRSLTAAFIAADPDSIVLEPFTREPNGSGGYVLTPGAARSAQTMRMIPTLLETTERHTLDGKVINPQWMLMGPWDAIVERGDRFSLDGSRYEVVHVQEKKDYQSKAEVAYLGSA